MNLTLKEILIDQRDTDGATLNRTSCELASGVKLSKLKYECWTGKLYCPNTEPKDFWSILKTLLDGSKIPVLPYFLMNNRLIENIISLRFHMSLSIYWGTKFLLE